MSSVKLRLIPSSPSTVLKSVCSMKPEWSWSYNLNLLSSSSSVVLLSCSLFFNLCKKRVYHSESTSTC